MCSFHCAKIRRLIQLVAKKINLVYFCENDPIFTHMSLVNSFQLLVDAAVPDFKNSQRSSHNLFGMKLSTVKKQQANPVTDNQLVTMEIEQYLPCNLIF